MLIHRTVLVLGLAAAGLMAQEAPLAITNARIITAAGPEIEKGVLLVQGGVIKAVGGVEKVPIPEGATVIDAGGKVVMPGLVDTHNHIGGIGGADGSGTIQPEVRVLDSINPLDSGFKRARAGGLTTLNLMPGSGHLLSGQTVYVKLREARTVEGMYFEPNAARVEAGKPWPAGGMKMANGTNSLREPPFSGTRGKSAAMVRERYIKAQEYQDKLARFAAERAAPEAKAEAKKDGDAPARDLALEALGEVLDGKRIVHHHTHRADDIMTVLRLQREFGFRVVLHHVSEAALVAEQIKKAQDEGGVLGCSVILIDSPGGKLEAVNLNMSTAGILEKAGVNVCIHTDDWIIDCRQFLRCGAMAVRFGMSREGAIRALTIAGAKMLDLDKRVGSLEAGKDADFIVLSGDPFSVYTHVEQTYVEGVKVFDRSDAEDRLFATGGYGAGRDQEPYMCCAPQGGTAWGE
jgi:imidazolonepropionase-like amidohydrolase